MAAPRCSDEDFARRFREVGAAQLADELGCNERSVYLRRRHVERAHGPLIPPTKFAPRAHPQRVELDIQDGTVIIGSDAHIWPGKPSTALRAFVHACHLFEPSAVILNGDVCDFPTISKHARIGWDERPEVKDELAAVSEQLRSIVDASGNARLVWTLGNHDARHETFLANHAPAYEGVPGVSLKDHFPDWEPAWSCWINGNVVIKHRWKNGVHAAHNNTVGAGLTMVTGHLHSLKVVPYTDLTGTRYGVDTGCLADPWGPQFTDYLEDNPRNWRSGFVVLTFVAGRLLPPELVSVWTNESVVFRGKIWRV